MNLTEIEKQRAAIVSAARNPKRVVPLATPTHQARTVNSFCGDEIEVFFEIKNAAIHDADAQIKGCLITQAAWNLLLPLIIGQSLTTAIEVAQSLLDALNKNTATTPEPLQLLLVFQHPSPRKRCASLAAEAMLAALFTLKSV